MKRLVICADGTWNQRDQVNQDTKRPRPTNVTKVARAVRPRDRNGVDQIVYYHDGIGTHGAMDRFTGGAFGHGMEQNIRTLYRFIVYNYEPGDELFLFGFSRGAFTVRSLSGFMDRVGLIEKSDDYYVPEIYRCYENNQGPGSPEWQQAFHRVRTPRPCPPLKFIGVWDTVGSLGVPGFIGQILNRGRYQYHDVALHPHIQNAFHALALDERRKAFRPDLWQRPPGWTGTLEQAWFPGVHSNIGGGFAPDGLANEALHWIAEKAEALGLELDTQYLGHFLPCFNSLLRDSMTPLYRVMGPLVRAVGGLGDGAEAIHQSTIDRCNHPACSYRPPNLDGLLPIAPPLTVVTTTRIARGTACPDLPPGAGSRPTSA